MMAPWRRLVVLGILAALLIPGATGRSAEARSAQQQCGVAGSLPSPPTPRPHYALSVRVRPGLRTVTGALAVTFTSPSAQGTNRLVFRLWPNGPRYTKTGAHLSVSAVRERGRMLPVSSPTPTTLVIARSVPA